MIVLQCMDNNSFFCQGEDGSLTLPVKAISDRKYHVVGELRIASREQVNNLQYKMIKPLLRAVNGAEVILLTCTPRYMYKECCGRHSLLDATELVKLKADMTAMKRALRSLLFADKRAKVRKIDPVATCNVASGDHYVDSVHLSTEEYEKLANSVMGCLARHPGPLEDGSGRGQPKPKRPKMASGNPPTRGARGRGWARGRGGRGGYGRPYGRRGSW